MNAALLFTTCIGQFISSYRKQRTKFPIFLLRNDGKNSKQLISVTAGQRFRRELEEEAIFCRGQELIEEVSRREEWTWTKWLLVVRITTFSLGIQLW